MSQEIVEVAISGPGKNALGSAVMVSLIERLEAAGGAPVLLTGAGDVFSAGLDLKEIAAADQQGMLGVLDKLERLTVALFDYPGPTVAYINGHAIAGGCVLALCCDRRVARRDDRIKIGLNETALGIRFPPRILRVVMDRVPRRHHEEVFLGAGLFAPDSAAELGLVHEVSDDAEAVARRRLARLAELPRHVYAGTKADLHGRLEITTEEKERFMREVLPTWTSPELKARILAFLGR